jgi:hypothetical protein
MVVSKNTGRPAVVQIPPAPHGAVVIILTAPQAPAQSSGRPCSTAHDAPWSRDEILALARRMVTEVRNGLARAAHYLRTMGIQLETALQALFPGRSKA